METPQQQAIAATENTIAQHQEAIRLAKQATWDIIAKQKAEALATSQMARQIVQQHRATAQSAEETAEPLDQPSSEMLHSASTESQESVSPRQTDEMQDGEIKAAPPGMETPVAGISIPPSLEQTIAQLHRDAAQVHQQMQADMLQTIQPQFGTENDADKLADAPSTP